MLEIFAMYEICMFVYHMYYQYNTYHCSDENTLNLDIVDIHCRYTL